MNPITEILLRLALFEGLAMLILGSVLLCRRFSEQPLERIRMVQLGLVAVIVALLFTFTSILPGRLYFSLDKTEQVSAQQELMPEALPEPSAETVFVSDIMNGTDAEIQPVSVFSKRPKPEPAFSSQEFSTSSSVEVESKAATIIPEPIASTAAPIRPQPEVQFPLSPETVFLSLCGLPILLLLVWNIAARIKLHGILKRSEPVFEFVLNLFRKIQGTSKYRVELRMSCNIDTPMVFGLFRPILLVPVALCDESVEKLRACLAHEWAHLRRGDLLTWNIVRLFQYPLWMQPFYWMLRSRLLTDQDFLADDERARTLADRADYADILLETARKRVSSMPTNVLGMAGRKSQLMRRIEMLFNSKRNLSQISRKRKFLLPVMLLTVLVLLGGSVRLGQKTVAEETAKPDIPVQKIKNEAPLEKPVVDVNASEMQPLLMTKEKNEFEISGKVYDTNGKPAPGVEVCSYEDEQTEASEPVITDENGFFVLKGKKTFAMQARSSDGRNFFLHIIVPILGYKNPRLQAITLLK